MEQEYKWKLERDPGDDLDKENFFLYRYIVQEFTNEGRATGGMYAFVHEETAMGWAETLAKANVRCSVYKELATTINRWDD